MTKKKIFKRIFIGLGLFIVLVIGLLAAAPFLFKDQIVAAVKDLVNDNLNAKVDFKDVDISLLKSFPNVSVGLQEYSVTGVDEFEGVNLASGELAAVTMDFWSAWNFGKVPLQIKSVTLDKPDINVLILKNGKANYDIAKPTTDTTAASPTAFQIQLQKYAINEGNIVYDDQLWGTYVKMVNLNHSGKGDFTQDVFDLDTETTIDQLTAESGGVAYLKKAKVDFDAGFNIDLPNQKYILRENKLKINDLEMNLDGWLAMTDEYDIGMDLTFNAPKSEFKSLLSLIPNAYIEGYENVKANGTFKLEGFVKGIYSSSPEQYPAFKINLDIANADLKYPDLPMGISGINTNIVVNSPSSNLDQMLVDISKFSLKVGNNPLEGYFKLKTPISDPDVDTKIKGKLDLGDLSRAFPMEGVKTLNGIVNMDVAARTKMSTIDKSDYANVDMSGEAAIESMDYVAEGLPAVRIDAMRLFFTPKNVQVPNFSMKLGKSDLSGNGSIDNILAYFSPDATMKGDFTIRSGYFNADEWMTEEASQQQPAAGTPPSTATSSEAAFDRFDFTLDAEMKQVDYDVYKIKDVVAKGNFTPNKLTANQLSAKIGDSDVSASGTITNVWNYLFYNEKLGGKLSLRSNYMNLNQFMTAEPAAATAAAPTEATEPFLVPGNIDMVVDANMNKVIYDNMELNNVKGSLVVANEEVKFTDLTANTLGGSLDINGGYNTQNHEKPKFDLGMKLKQMDFQKSFNTFNTFQAIAPIGKFMTGVFNTELSMSSALNKDLSPDLNTLAAAGLLQTLNAQLKGVKPLEAIGNKLNVDAFKNLQLKDTKNWFTVKDGAVLLQEFDTKYQDIDMKIGGSHKLVGDMDYHIIAKIPREKIGKNPLGAAANSGLEFLGGEASKLGLNIGVGEFINVQINIGGTMDDPKVGFKLLGTEGQGGSVKDAVVDKVKDEAQKQIDKVQEEAQKRLDEQKQKAEAEAAKLADKAKAEAEKKAQEAAKKVADEAAKKAADEAKKKLDEEAKKKLEDLNPFKKKKGGG
ncbi:MAG: hypothetical protein H6577_18590 [Lewinellaceae bacterium]|nr:hypothetical protein [Saprospiraceae bacterium]MCB9340134.1 hypothetical protein [Lewinellaceae bacterium]